MTVTPASFLPTLLDLLGPPRPLEEGQRPDGDFAPRLMIDGEVRDAADDGTFDNLNPATGETIGAVADGTSADLQAAVGAARRAFGQTRWRHDCDLRAKCLGQLHESLARHAAELRRALVLEIGCPVRLANGVQVDEAIEKFAFFVAAARSGGEEVHLADASSGGLRSIRRIAREPIGVVGAVTPWNIPLDISLAKIGGALAAGNAVVHKPAPDSPWTAAIVGRLVAEETDIPAGIFNVVMSSDHTLGAALTADPRVDAITFTGSTATGRRVMAAAAEEIKRVHLELGGKSPNLILDDVDFERVVPVAAALGCFNAGESCILPSRLLVPEAQLDRCIDLAAAGMNAVTVGDPLSVDTFMGPLINATHRERVLAAIEDGLGAGGEVVTGGGTPPHLDAGFYVEPTLIAGACPDSALIQQEIFGPVVCVQSYRDLDEALALANGTPFGLAAYVWSGDVDRAQGVARELRAGMVGINGGQFTGAEMPFGGVGQSGIGREWGALGVEEFQEVKTIATGVAR